MSEKSIFSIQMPPKIRILKKNPLLFSLLLFLFSSLNSFSQCYITDYRTGKRTLKVDGNNISFYSTGQRVYKMDDAYLLSYPGCNRLLKMDGNYIIRYNDNKRIGKLDGQYLLDYSNSKRVAKLDCPGRKSALAAAAYFLN
jgi:hypothetical protein